MGANDMRSMIDRCGYGTEYGCGGHIVTDAHVVERVRPVTWIRGGTGIDNGHSLFHPECHPPGTVSVFRERLMAEVRARYLATLAGRLAKLT